MCTDSRTELFCTCAERGCRTSKGTVHDLVVDGNPNSSTWLMALAIANRVARGSAREKVASVVLSYLSERQSWNDSGKRF